MNLWHSLAGVYRIRILSASTLNIIGAATNDSIQLYDLTVVDELTVECSVLRKDYDYLKLYLTKRGADVQVIAKKGVYWHLKNLTLRPALLLGMMIILFLNLYLPTKILFIQVEGNISVPAETILDVAEEYGIRFGVSRRDIRSEKIKNALLNSIPELQWAGINTAGCVATITVQEGDLEENNRNDTIASSIVADLDGVIQQITVTAGTPVCKVGQAVKKGQLLVSGYTDLGLLVRLTNADAEIIANTQRQIHAIYPTDFSLKGKFLRSEKRYCKILGKNIIKLYNHSGISDSSCVKMYDVKQLTLPGGFQLPLSFVTETRMYYDYQFAQQPDPASLLWIEDYVQRYLNTQMIAGSINRSSYSGELNHSTYHLDGKFFCTEVIGKKRNEGTRINNG